MIIPSTDVFLGPTVSLPADGAPEDNGEPYGAAMRIFISHDLVEQEYFQRFTDHLSGAGFAVYDSASVPAGASVRSTVRRLMADSDCHVVLLGRKTCSSPEVNLEIAAARLAAADRPWFRIVPLVLDRSAELPPLLYGYATLDGRVSPTQAAVALMEALRYPAPPRDTAAETRQLAISAQSYLEPYADRSQRVEDRRRALARIPALALLMGLVGLFVSWLASLLPDGSPSWWAVAMLMGTLSIAIPISVAAAGRGSDIGPTSHQGR